MAKPDGEKERHQPDDRDEEPPTGMAKQERHREKEPGSQQRPTATGQIFNKHSSPFLRVANTAYCGPGLLPEECGRADQAKPRIGGEVVTDDKRAGERPKIRLFFIPENLTSVRELDGNPISRIKPCDDGDRIERDVSVLFVTAQLQGQPEDPP